MKRFRSLGGMISSYTCGKYDSYERRRARCRCFSLAFAFLVLSVLGLSSFGSAHAASASKGIMINVVYDDSGSMVRDNDDTSIMIERWSQAKYAMEVFCAMLGSDDVMNIYPMSLNGSRGLTLEGSDPDRVSSVHAMNGCGDTPFSAVTSAASDLLEADESYEKWLVVITDGEFNGTDSSFVQNALNAYNDAGVSTVYLGIGDDAPALDGNESKGGYVEKVEDGSDVLSKITDIANQIFSHQELGASRISSSAGTTMLSVDIPVSQLVVFAQGDDAFVGDVSLNGEKVEPSLVQSVKYSDVKPVGWAGAVADESLNGILAFFEAGDSPFESGSYSVEAKGSAGVEYYYTPGVTVNCDLMQNGVVVNREDELYAGNYEVSLNYVNPLTNEAIESELLPTDGMSLVLENNGETQAVDGISGFVSLVEGAVSLSATAVLPGRVHLTSEKAYKVLPDPIELVPSLADVPEYTSEDLNRDDCPSVTLTVHSKETGVLLSEVEWKTAEVSINNSGNIEWSCAPGDEAGTWKLVPFTEDTSAVFGSLDFDVEVSYRIDDQYAHGISHESVPVRLTVMDAIRKYLPLIMVGVVSLLLALLYGPKKRFSGKELRKLKPTCYWDDKDIQHRKQKLKINLASRLMPFCPHRVVVYCSDNSAGCDFPSMVIEAAGKGRFRIVNYREMASSAKIRGLAFDEEKEVEKLKKRDFSFGGFYLTGFDNRGNERGTFRFR